MGINSKKPIRIKDIAAHLGLSSATISIVLNKSKGYERISDETKKRVLEYCEEANFQPNYFAKGLKERVSRQIAVVVSSVNNQFSPQLISGVRTILSDVGYVTVIIEAGYSSDAADIEKIKASIGRIVSGGVDGIIAHIPSIWSDIEPVIKNKVPVVRVDEDKNKVPCVGFDQEYAGYCLTKHFLEQGCKSIAFVNSNIDSYTYISRYNGYKKALLEEGIEVDESLVKNVDALLEGGVAACNWLMNQKKLPRAVIAATDVIAHPLLFGLLAAGIKIPEQIAIASIDDTAYSKLFTPSLTSVYVPAIEMGERAAKLILDLIGGRDHTEQYIEVPIKLNIRKSSIISN
jgi:LacI family transcriptional regulator